MEHDPARWHSECPGRLGAIVKGMKKAGFWGPPNVKVVEPKPATRDEIALVHDPDYISLVKRSSAAEIPIDADTPVRKNTFELALLAAGGAIEAARAVKSGETENSFALVRPPGHHAFSTNGGGFCYFNNLAIAVKSCGLKTLILDFDCHAGNGTTEIFWEDKSVLYISLHQWPLYPGTGWWNEIGKGSGEGYTINLPLLPGTADDVYLKFLKSFLPQLMKQFKPELIGVSAGFDAHRSDPLTQMNLSSHAYYQIGEFLKNRKVFAVLEGGYNLDALSRGAPAFLAGVRGEKFDFGEEATTTPKEIAEKNIQRLSEIKKLLSKYWDL